MHFLNNVHNKNVVGKANIVVPSDPCLLHTFLKHNCTFRINSVINGLISLFVLRFYGSVNPMGSCRARSVYLTTRLLGRLSPLSG